VRQDVRGQVEPACARADTLGAQAVLVRALRQGVRAQELPLQARGVVVHARLHRAPRSNDYRVPRQTAATRPPRRTTNCHVRVRRPSLSDGPLLKIHTHYSCLRPVFATRVLGDQSTLPVFTGRVADALSTLRVLTAVNAAVDAARKHGQCGLSNHEHGP